MLDKAESLDDEIARRAMRQQRRLEVAGEAPRIGEVDDEADTLDTRRYRLGLSCIDCGMGPLRPGALTVAAAVTGYGKTSVLEQCGRANSEDWCNFLVTLEMTEAEIQANMIAREMGVALEDYEREKRNHSSKYTEALDRVRSLNLRLWRPPVGRTATAQDIFRRAERAQADILLIDYTKYMDGWNPGKDASDIVGWISARAKATRMHVVLLAQLKEEARGKRPTLEHMEDTKRLNHEASTVILIHRPFAGKDPKADVVAELIVAKNRKGKTFRGHTHWYGPTHTFYTMTREEEARVACCGKAKAKKPAVATAANASRESGMTKAEEDALLNEEFPF
jgi:replicative DNA helicase